MVDRDALLQQKQPSLSPREREVLAAWGRYPDPSELAAYFGISLHTVQTHLKRARRKLGVRRTVEGWQKIVLN